MILKADEKLVSLSFQIYTIISHDRKHPAKDSRCSVKDNVRIVTAVPIGKKSAYTACQKTEQSQLACQIFKSR